MTRRTGPRRLPRPTARVAQLLAAVAVLAILATPTLHGDSEDCEGIVIPDGCLVTVTGSDTPNPDDGYAVTDEAGIPFWNYYQQQGPHVLGYPISQRFMYHGIVHQAFQKAILQWQHWEGRIAHLNTLDVLNRDYPHVKLSNVPPHQWLPADEGAPFEQIKANHLALLDANPDIRDFFLAAPNWLDRFGLPIAYAVMHGGDLEVLRAQRAVLTIWRVPVAGVTPGNVNLSNIGDDLKKLTNVLIPDGAEGPMSAADAASGFALASLPLDGDPAPEDQQQETSSPPPPQPAPEPVQQDLTGPGLDLPPEN